MKSFFNFFSSLKLTVWLLAASLILIFFGTLDQVNWGIQEAQQKYFQSIIALWGYPPTWVFGNYLKWLHLPIPGGYLVGPLMLINLACAHFKYFRPRWATGGIVLIHAGIAMLLISQLVTNLVQEESFLWFAEGGTKNYIESFHRDELVIIDKTDPEKDQVVAIPMEMLERTTPITNPRLPFRVEVRGFFPNAEITRVPEGNPSPTPVTQGLGATMNLAAKEISRTFKGDRNNSTAIVELSSTQGSIGTWLVSPIFLDQLPPQVFTFDGRTYEIAMRYKRTYLPFTLTLLDFTHERYPGTQIPKNFSSKIQLKDPATKQDREVIIYMNHPLRYGGLTFYQASFSGEFQSMLQVVANPSWLAPYIACILVTLGMLWQFGWGLFKFINRR
ncbi:MAG: cytochrome c biogenesis protein ResB [Verrucomicrobiota bacterium]|nr:cytochrome c biogenesis protein ResB [Verrucomicrobiota bacterium]